VTQAIIKGLQKLLKATESHCKQYEKSAPKKCSTSTDLESVFHVATSGFQKPFMMTLNGFG
jgi:hypothetical protein